MRKIKAPGNVATALFGLNCPRTMRAKNVSTPPSMLENTAFGFSFQNSEPTIAGDSDNPKLARPKRTVIISRTKIATSMATNTRIIMVARIIFERSMSNIPFLVRATKSFAMLDASKYTSVSIVDMIVASTMTMPTPNNPTGTSADNPQKKAWLGSMSVKWLRAAIPIRVMANPKIRKRSEVRNKEFRATFTERAEKILCQMSAEAKVKKYSN